MKKAIDILVDASTSMNDRITPGCNASSKSKYEHVLSYLKEEFPKVYQSSLEYGLCCFGMRQACRGNAEGKNKNIIRVGDIKRRSLEDFSILLDELPSKVSGTTPLYDAIFSSIQKLDECESDHRTILVFSDGEDTSSEQKKEEVIALAKERSVSIEGLSGLEIFAVGVGKLDPSLEQVVSETGGSAIELKKADNRPVYDILSDIALRHLTTEEKLERKVEIVIRDAIAPLVKSSSDLLEKVNEENEGVKHHLDKVENTLANRIEDSNSTREIKNIEGRIKGVETQLMLILKKLKSIEGDTKEVQWKISNRVVIFFALTNVVMPLVLAFLLLRIGDGVFNMFDIIVELKKYLVGVIGGVK